jgi:hypothetical protein
VLAPRGRRLIARGWVLVDGELAEMGMPVAPDVASRQVLPQARHQQAVVTILLHTSP